MNSIPQFVQEAASGEETISIILEIGRKHGLHADVIAALADLNSYMLLGLINPQEFQTELTVRGITEENVKAITEEINKRIFIPLHDKMRKEGMGSTAAPAVARPVSPTPPAPAYVPQPVPMPTPTPPPPQQRPYTPPPPPVRPVASSPLPPRTVLPGSMAGQVPPPIPSINKLEGRVLPLPVYDSSVPPRTSPPAPTQPTPPPTARPYNADPYRESLDKEQ